MDVNPLKRIWDSGDAAVGTALFYSRDSTTVQLAAAAGLDFVLFDLEHRPYSYETVHDLSQAARNAGMASLVGPRDISDHAISHVLDIGASGVVVPHVQTLQEVELAINSVRYPPIGRRGRTGVAGHNLYAPTRSQAEEIDHYNNDVALLLKVESEAAIAGLDGLVAPEGVDGVMVGPLDLSLDIGVPGQMSHPRVLELIDHVRKVCRARNVQYGTILASADEVPEAIEDGATWVVAGSEMGFLSEAWSRAGRAKPSRRPKK